METTEVFDRAEKCERYQTWNSTLTDYLLVSQGESLIEHFSRQEGGGWLLHRYRDLGGVVPLPTMVAIRFAAASERVTLASVMSAPAGVKIRRE
mgnify:CR=1 FL=1